MQIKAPPHKSILSTGSWVGGGALRDESSQRPLSIILLFEKWNGPSLLHGQCFDLQGETKERAFLGTMDEELRNNSEAFLPDAVS